MIINKMILENYGLFAGYNEFDLSPNRQERGSKTRRPIILFGGKNGAGKTTFLGATRLLLYGKQSVEGKVTQQEYNQQLISHLHRNKRAATSAHFARIGLEFDHILNGEKSTFYVERSWEVKSEGKVSERFEVNKNGSPLNDISPEHWESFIADIVPARLSQLFFFDGEKIKNIAEDLSSNAAIAEAIQSLLGIDNVLSLKSDLKIYKSRLIKDADPKAYKKNLDELLKRLKKIETTEALLTDEASDLRTQLDGVQITTTKLEKSLSKKGGGFASKRSENLQRVELTKERIQHAEAAIRSLTDSTLPFSFCPTIRAKMIDQLEQEQLAQASVAAAKNINSLHTKLIDAAAKLSQKEQSCITAFIEKNVGNYLQEVSEASNAPLIHQLSDREAAHIIELATNNTDNELKTLLTETQQLEELHIALHNINRDLEKAPAEEDISFIVKDLKSSSKELGELQGKAKVNQEALRALTNEKVQLYRDKEKIEKGLKAGAKEAEKLAHLEKLGPALDVYRKKLTKTKIEALRSEVTECFNRLARKSDFVKGINIDHETFAVTLLDEHDRSIPREDLSSGEKQIFAIAMLWGLARTSGRPLPVVIDTPLGRLDSDHRKNLIENYFPHAGHQVILLSTDTEVDQKLYADLSKHISQSYHLVYDHKKGHTTATKDAYFWENESA